MKIMENVFLLGCKSSGNNVKYKKRYIDKKIVHSLEIRLVGIS